MKIELVDERIVVMTQVARHDDRACVARATACRFNVSSVWIVGEL